MAGIISIILRSIFHAYITGTIYLYLQKKYSFKRDLFLILVLVVAAFLEIREHLIKEPNTPFLTRDFILVGLILLTIILFRIIKLKNGQLISIYLLSGILLVIISTSIDYFFKPSGQHIEYKHFIDVIAWVTGPILITPLFKKWHKI